MSVSHLASSESHPGTTASTNQLQFPWDHPPGGTPRGVTVFVWTAGNAGLTLATGVTYAGVAVPAVDSANRTGSSAGNMKVFHLGAGVPTASPAEVIVFRTNNAVEMWAVCVTQAADGDTEIYTPGIVKDTSTTPAVEQAVTDAGTGSASVRYVGAHSAYSAPPPVGPNTTHLQSIDIGAICGSVGVETVPGTGSRLVGLVGTAVPKAMIHFAVQEVFVPPPSGVAHLASSESHPGTTASANVPSFPWNHAPGGTARGATVCIWTAGNAGVSLATGVTYGGVAVPFVAQASRTGASAGNMSVFHLGAGVPAANPAQVVVTRTNNAVEMWAVCVTQSAEDDTEIYVPGLFRDESAGAATEQPVSDGSTGRTSVRYYAAHSAYLAPPTAGPNTTNLQSIDIGAICGAVGVETVAGVGTRYVGIQDAASAPKAILHFAVREFVPTVPTGVSHLGESESHLTTSGSLNEPSFTWEHEPGGLARGVTVFVWSSGSTGESLATGVTYEGVAVPAVSGGEAIRTGAEAGNMKTFHLGAAVPTADPATVVVTRVNNPVVMWACCVTQAAGTDTEVYSPGINRQVSGSATLEGSAHDGNPGSDSQRYAAGHFGYSDPPPASPNSTLIHDLDFGSMFASVVRETVPGQGLRPVGFVEPTFAPKAIVHLAVRHLVIVPLGDLNVFVYGFSGALSPIEPIEPGVLPTLTKLVPPETLHLRDITPISINRTSPTTATFTASPDHAAVLDYTAELWTYPGAVTREGTLSLGVPTPDASNNITVDLAPLFAGQPAGDYTIVIVTTTTGGSTPSEHSNVFTLPVA